MRSLRITHIAWGEMHVEDVRDAGLTLLQGYPLYDPLRTAPRFQNLLAKIG